MAGKIIALIFFILLMGFFPVFAQMTAYQGINDAYFKRIKIKRFKFLFKGTAWQSPEKRGVIKPMLAVQLMGYILELISIILVFVLLFAVSVEDKINLALLIISSIFGTEIIALIVVMAITGAVSRKREKESYTKDMK